MFPIIYSKILYIKFNDARIYLGCVVESFKFGFFSNLVLGTNISIYYLRLNVIVYFFSTYYSEKNIFLRQFEVCPL